MKKFIIAIAALLLLANGAHAEKIAGVEIPEKMELCNQNLVLNGAGIRKKLWVKVYIGALYVENKSSSDTALLNADESMAIRMHFVYDKVGADDMVDSWSGSLGETSKDYMTQGQDRVEKFKALFNRDIVENDKYDMVYAPDKGTTVFFNDRELGSIEGLDFKKALFAVWLGDDPPNDALKEGMLGK
ncbi:MAG: chalcone isomerase family protein [Desulfatibacillaceae bacterium]